MIESVLAEIFSCRGCPHVRIKDHVVHDKTADGKPIAIHRITHWCGWDGHVIECDINTLDQTCGLQDQ